MTLHYLSVVFLLASATHHVISGDLTRWLLKAARKDETGNTLHNAVVAMFAANVVLFGGATIVLLLPGIPAEVEMALGGSFVIAVVAAAIWRRSLSSRTLLLITSGALILAGNLI